MKKALLIALVAALTMGAAAERASAQNFELGVRAGIGSQNMDLEAMDIVNGKTKVGWNVAAVGRVRLIGFGDGILGAGLFFQPEVVYSQSNFKGEQRTSSGGASSSGGSTPVKIAMKTVDIPLLLSLKASIVRVQAGPVFNLMNNFETTGDMELLPVRAPVGYALGASVDFIGLTFDARYHGEFKKMSFRGDWADIKSRFSSWSVGIGKMF